MRLPGKTEYLTICGIKVFTAHAGTTMPAPSTLDDVTIAL